MKYKVVAVIWEDHRRVDRSSLPVDPEDLIFPTITIGALVRKTKRLIVIASDIERYEDRDDSTYTVIFRTNVNAIKEFGEIEIDNIRITP